MGANILASGSVIAIVILLGIIILVVKTYKKAVQGQALVRTGSGGTKVSFSGFFVIPVLHKMEVMDITIKTIVISRLGVDGLICKDNMRADIKVSFFVRVNKTMEDVIQVAQTIGCYRASFQESLENLFDAKFSEALKTVGKQFDFVELYNSRVKFKQEILHAIGTDLNGYVLDDCAIDYLEQTALETLKKGNILDAEGIKKITELTSAQIILANQIERDKEKTIKKQDVEARETILELEKQLAEKEEQQKREIASAKAREEAATKKIQEEQRQIGEQARISAEEEIQVAEQNKERQVIVATKNKERTEAIETQGVLKDKELEITEREKIVTLAQISKEKAVEEEKKNIQDVIKQRVMVEKTVVEEEEKIKDTRAFASADREKAVAITLAEKDAEEGLVKEIKAAEANKTASVFKAEQKQIEAEAQRQASSKEADAIKILAEAKAAQEAAIGMSEAQVIEAKADANEKQGKAEAHVIEMKAVAQAKGIEVTSQAEAGATKKIGVAEAEVISAKAVAGEEKGMAENRVKKESFTVEAKGIQEKADAMKKLDGVGKEHEEFKIRIQKDKEIELAEINIQRDIAEAQAKVIAEALKAANIDIVGGETMFFEQIMGAITKGKKVDRTVNNSKVLQDLKDQFFNSEGGRSFKENFRHFIEQFGVSSEDLKNLSLSNLLLKLSSEADSADDKSMLSTLLGSVQSLGLADKTAKEIGIG
ncbi:MAG: hypothetical protein K9H64_20460 [Bacteroidales bacterium]|nr:hypothetical protein [Bacteroidales bacterium]MCF8458420.1 hypothetical protein [Bacteroidales bacterium]